MDELPFQEFKKMVLSQDMVKMHVVLSFIFDVETLREKIIDKWRDFLEESYLEEKVFAALEDRKARCL